MVVVDEQPINEEVKHQTEEFMKVDEESLAQTYQVHQN